MNMVVEMHGANYADMLLKARYAIVPRGKGRTSYIMAEVIQRGLVPVYVWDDVPWLPYRSLWEKGEMGYHVRVRDVAVLLRKLANGCVGLPILERTGGSNDA